MELILTNPLGIVTLATGNRLLSLCNDCNESITDGRKKNLRKPFSRDMTVSRLLLGESQA
jgi:hypothetical protein